MVRATVESVLQMSAEQVAVPKAQRLRGPAREVLAWGAGGRPDRNQTITARFFGLLAWV